VLKRSVFNQLHPFVIAVNEGKSTFSDKFDGITYVIPPGYQLQVPRAAYYNWMGYPDELWEAPEDIEAEAKRVRLRWGEIEREQRGSLRPKLTMIDLQAPAPEKAERPRVVEATEEAFPDLAATSSKPPKPPQGKRGKS
jgi:hypothetical protein